MSLLAPKLDPVRGVQSSSNSLRSIRASPAHSRLAVPPITTEEDQLREIDDPEVLPCYRLVPFGQSKKVEVYAGQFRIIGKALDDTSGALIPDQ